MADDDGGKGAATRTRIVHAAAHQFAVRPYSQVNLDDIAAGADVARGMLYTHFPSKMALATALVEHHLDVSWAIVGERLGLGLGGLEALIDYAYVIASADIGHALTRAAFNLFESVGRFNGLQARTAATWAHTFADIATNGIARGDIRPECNPEQVARLLISAYLGVRQMSSLDDPQQFIGDFEAILLLALPGFANPARLPYLSGFITRRSALAIKNATPLGTNNL